METAEGQRSLLIDQAPSAPAEEGGGRRGHRLHLSLRGGVVSREVAWRLLGDTDWLNRVADSGAVQRQEIVVEPDGLPVVVGALAGPLGTRIPYQERWTSWAFEQYFRQVRDIDHALLRRTDYHARLRTVAPGQVVPEIDLTLTVAPLLGRALWLQVAHLRRRWQAALDALAVPEATSSARALPEGARIALDAWGRHADPDIVAAFRRYLPSARPTELRRMRAFALADRWNIPRDAVLEAMLHGVEAGALELYWSVRCTRCHGPLANSSVLSDLPDHVDCPSCRIGTDADLGATVEALFAPHPAVAPRIQEAFCTLYPLASPEMFGVFTLAPQQTLQQTLHLPPGRWRLGPGGEQPDLLLETLPSPSAAPPARLCWRPGLSAAGPVQCGAGAVHLALENDAAARRRLYLLQADRREDRVLAAYVSNHPRFRAQMGHQSLSLEQRTSVRVVALLFTDLSGSTALYESLGDARAFALVRDHFRILRGAAAHHQGAVVKTIGDSVMASFADPADAVRCALQMQADFRRWADALSSPVPPAPLQLKVGLHVGTALAVQSDAAGLDWFGSTVNLAARAEGAASGGQILWTEAVHQHPAVQRLLREKHLQPVRSEQHLKGLRAPIALYRLEP